jgi:putative PEP-CTERM system TPR-repeat lipoprotein
VTPNPSLQRTRYSGLRPLSFAGELKRSFEGPLSTRSGFVVGAICLALVAGCAKETPDSLIHAAERHLAQRDYRAAQIELKNALQLAPNSGASYRLLGTTLLRGGDPTAAETALRRALALGERPDDVLPSLALALVRQGQPDRLTSEFGTRKLDNRSAAASFQTNLGQAWMMLGDSKQAGDAFEAALAHVPNYPPARLGQAQISAQHGRLDYASSIADDVLAADPRLTEAHAFKAQLHLSHGQRSEAVGSLEKALAIEPRDASVRLALVSLHLGDRNDSKAQALLDIGNSPVSGDPRLVYFRGLLALRKGDLQTARDEVNRILRQAPDHAPALALAGEIELRSNNLSLAESHALNARRSDAAAAAPRRLLGAIYLRQGQPAKALDVLQPLLERADSRDPQLTLLAGEAYLANGDAVRAAELFEGSKSDVASGPAARLRLGQIALARGDFEHGVGELQAASAMDAERHRADLLLVALHLRRHEPEKALAAAEVLIKKRPSEPLGYVLAGTAHLAGKEVTKARQRFDAALKIQSDNLPALRGMGEVGMAEGKPGEAMRRYEALLTKKPNDEQLLVALAELQERAGDVAEAGATLRKAVAANRKSPIPYAALVQYELRRRDPKAAIAVAQEAVLSNPAEPRLIELLGDTQEIAGAGADAVKSFEELARLEPRSPSALLKLAAAQAKQRDFTGAARSLRQAQRAAPDNEAIARDLVAVYLSAGKHEEALSVVKASQFRKPEAALGHALEGDVHASRKNWPEAERAYRVALKATPQSSAIAVGLCRVMSASGRKSEAAKFAKDWISKNPADVSMRLYVADTALAAKDYKAAVLQYEAVLERSPNNVPALNNLAWSLGKLNDPRAVGLAERAVELAPNSPPVLDTLGMLHVEQGDPKKGLEYLARARSLAPNRKDLRLHYAMGLIRVGQAEQGKAELQELASSQEDFPGKASIPALLAKL